LRKLPDGRTGNGSSGAVQRLSIFVTSTVLLDEKRVLDEETHRWVVTAQCSSEEVGRHVVPSSGHWAQATVPGHGSRPRASWSTTSTTFLFDLCF